jgi:hypothetical protein
MWIFNDLLFSLKSSLVSPAIAVGSSLEVRPSIDELRKLKIFLEPEAHNISVNEQATSTWMKKQVLSEEWYIPLVSQDFQLHFFRVTAQKFSI